MIKSRLENLRKPLAEQLSVARRDLALPRDRAPDLEQQALEFATREIAAWESRIKEAVAADPLPDLDEPGVTALLKRAAVKPPRVESELWAEAAQKLFSPEEQKQIKTLAAARIARRKDANARFALAELDDAVAFTSEQRNALLPLAIRLQPAQPESSSLVMMSSTPVLQAMAKATDDDLKSILDDPQRERWRTACQGGPGMGAAPSSANSLLDEEGDEQAISDFLLERAEQEKRVQLQKMLVRVEDAARVIPLAPPRLRPLELAARGSVEAVLGKFRGVLEGATRPNLRAYEGQSVAMRRSELESNGTISFSGPEYVVEEMPIWKHAVQSLGPAEREKWSREITQRLEFRQDAAAKVAVSEFDKLVTMTAEQWQNLETPVLKFMREYLPDLGSGSTAGFGASWLRDYYCRFIPVIAMETEVKATLEPEQWARWMESGRPNQTKFYWEQTKSQHAERLKAEATSHPP